MVYSLGLHGFGLVGKCRVLVAGVVGARGHIIHLRLGHIFENVQVDLCVYLLLGLNELGRHDVPLIADDAQDLTLVLN